MGTATTTPLAQLGEGSEWAVGMPAYWLEQVQPGPSEATDLLARFYYVRPTGPKAGVAYDQRLLVRVGGTERAVTAVVAFFLRYLTSMGHQLTEASIRTVSERMVRAWELVSRPGAV